MQLEFAVGERAAKIELHVAALLRLTVHLALEETMHAAAIFLRAVQSEIGVAHQLLAALAVTGRQRNPDGSADHHLVAVEIIRCAQDVDQARGEAARLIRRDVGGKDDCELVPSEPGCEIIAADLTAQPLGHELQQPITDRMAKRIIDVLEQVEINAEHRDALVAALTAFQRLLQALLVELAVGQIGQAVMMGHIGDAGFGLATLGDVDDSDKVAVTAAERDAPAEGKHLDFAAVGLQVPPVTGGAIGLADLAQRLAMADPFIFGPNLAKLHLQEFFAAVAIMLHGGVIDAEKAHGLGVEYPHRHRVVVEQQAERSLAPLQRGDVRDRQREDVTESGCAQAQAAIVVIEFELIAMTAHDDIAQAQDHICRAKQVSAFAQAAPLQLGRRHLEELRCTLVVVHDLEIGRTARSVADRRQRQHAFVGGRIDRIKQIVVSLAFVHIDADQRAAPARCRRQRQHVVGPHHTVAHAMGYSEIRTTVPDGIGRGLAERGRTVRRQRAQGNIPALVIQPFLDVAARARDLKALVLLIQKQHVIGKPAETAEHHLFITRQPFAGTHGGEPLALQDGDIVEQFSAEFLLVFWLFLDGYHDIPHATGVLPARIQRGAA